MAKYKNYRNNYTKNNIIHSIDNVMVMPFKEVASRRKELSSQYKQIGFPSNRELGSSSNVVYVEAYTKDDGTSVRGHWRSKPGMGSILSEEENSPQEQPQLNESLTKYMGELLDKNKSEYIGNETPTSTQSDTPIYPEGGVVKGKISKSADKNAGQRAIGDKLKEWLFTNALTEKLFPMASHSVKDGMDNLSIAKKNPNATVYNSINDLEDKTLADKFKKLKTDESIKGIVYDSNSKEAQKISKSKELNNYVDEVIRNGGIPQKDTLEFKRNKNIFSKDNDLHYSLQNVTVHEPKISEDGKTFTCKILDVSDFEKRPDSIKNIPNNWGYNMQEKGQYRNYFEVIEIEIPLTEEQRKLLTKRKKL